MQTILIVDDEEYILDSLADLIRDELNVDILRAENGLLAIETIKTTDVDVVLSDIHMPVMNGLELIQAIRNLGLETPVVFLTGYADRGSMAVALRMGASDFVEKPYDEEELMDSLRRSLEVANIQKDIEAELEEICEGSELSGVKLDKFREAKKRVLAIKFGKKKNA